MEALIRTSHVEIAPGSSASGSAVAAEGVGVSSGLVPAPTPVPAGWIWGRKRTGMKEERESVQNEVEYLKAR